MDYLCNSIDVQSFGLLLNLLHYLQFSRNASRAGLMQKLDPGETVFGYLFIQIFNDFRIDFSKMGGLISIWLLILGFGTPLRGGAQGNLPGCPPLRPLLPRAANYFVNICSSRKPVPPSMKILLDVKSIWKLAIRGQNVPRHTKEPYLFRGPCNMRGRTLSRVTLRNIIPTSATTLLFFCFHYTLFFL